MSTGSLRKTGLRDSSCDHASPKVAPASKSVIRIAGTFERIANMLMD